MLLQTTGKWYIFMLPYQ